MFDITDPVVTLLGVPQILDGAYTGSGASNLSATAGLTAFAQADLSGNTDLNSAAVIGVQGAAVMTSEATLSVSETIVYAAASIVVGTSELVATSTRLFFLTMDLSGETDLSSDAIIVNITESRPLSGQSSLVATMFQPLNILTLPTVEYNYSNDRLMRFYGIDSGQSLIITGTTGTIVEFQTGTEIDAADYYFGGGRRHVLDDTEVTAVTNAGFGNLITIEGVPSGV
jgi:hypothetical protein